MLAGRQEGRPKKRDRSLRSFDAVQAASHALSQIGVDGYTVEATTDFDAVPKLAKEMGKPHLTPLLSPLSHDFTTQTAFWLILRDEQGRPAGCVGARLEIAAENEIPAFWSRVFARHYPGSEYEITLSSSARDALVGRLAYIGDLYISPTNANGLGIASRNRLSSILHLMHALVALEWKVDASYSFITEKDALRGAAVQYGYTVQLPMQKNWKGRPPGNRYEDEWLIILPAGDHPAVFRRRV